MHNISDNLDVIEALAANDRAAGAVSSSGIDLTDYMGSVEWLISAGSFGVSATLDAKLQESSVDVAASYTDITGASITQLTAADSATLEQDVRAFTKRYARLTVTVGTANVVVSATMIGQKQQL